MGQFISHYGVYQWTAGVGNEMGELAGFIDRLKTSDPELFQKYFAANGLNVAYVFESRPGDVLAFHHRFNSPAAASGSQSRGAACWGPAINSAGVNPRGP
jgi:hypothetical protein